MTTKEKVRPTPEEEKIFSLMVGIADSDSKLSLLDKGYLSTLLFEKGDAWYDGIQKLKSILQKHPTKPKTISQGEFAFHFANFAKCFHAKKREMMDYFTISKEEKADGDLEEYLPNAAIKDRTEQQQAQTISDPPVKFLDTLTVVKKNITKNHFDSEKDDEIDLQVYQDLKTKNLHYPFKFEAFRKYLKNKHMVCRSNLFNSKTGEKSGIRGYYGSAQVSTLFRFWKSGKIQELVSLEFVNGLSYKRLHKAFSEKISKSSTDTLYKVFSTLFSHKMDFRSMANETHAMLFFQLFELLLYEEGARYLTSIAHVVMWISLLQDDSQSVSFTDLPFSVEGAMLVLRYLRGIQGFTRENINYIYDYFIQHTTSRVLTEYRQKEDELTKKFYTRFNPRKEGGKRTIDDFDVLKLHILYYLAPL